MAAAPCCAREALSVFEAASKNFNAHSEVVPFSETHEWNGTLAIPVFCLCCLHVALRVYMCARFFLFSLCICIVLVEVASTALTVFSNAV